MLPFFVICRLGIGIYNQARLEKMIDIFEIVTLSSVLNQSNKNFNLLIVIDAHMPSASLERLARLVAPHDIIKIIKLDIEELAEMQVGGFSYIWDACQKFILANAMLQSENEFILTSILDADDAIHKDTIALVRMNMENLISEVESSEAKKATWCRHSGGLVTTFPRGYGWLMHSNQFYDINFSFHSMSVFVLSRFSSNISACSSRHAKWQNFAEVVDFKVGRYEKTPQMWIYARHDEAVLPWQSDTKFQDLDTDKKKEFASLFGIDFDKYGTWLSQNPKSNYSGTSAGEKYNVMFKIAAQNKKLNVLKSEPQTTQIKTEIDAAIKKRLELIEQLKTMAG